MSGGYSQLASVLGQGPERGGTRAGIPQPGSQDSWGGGREGVASAEGRLGDGSHQGSAGASSGMGHVCGKVSGVQDATGVGTPAVGRAQGLWPRLMWPRSPEEDTVPRVT